MLSYKVGKSYGYTSPYFDENSNDGGELLVIYCAAWHGVIGQFEFSARWDMSNTVGIVIEVFCTVFEPVCSRYPFVLNGLSN